MLEIGCAGGHFLSYARECGWNVTGVELNTDMAGRARINFGLDVHSLSVEDLPGPLVGQRFDVVYMSHVLEHLLEPDSALGKIRKLLSPDGALVLRVPNLDSFLFRLLGRHYVELYPDVHLFHYNRRSLTRLLAREGFTVLDLRTRNCDFANEGFILTKGILDAVGVYRKVKLSRGAPARQARALRLVARSLLTPLYAATYPAWALSSWLGFGYELLAVAKSKPEDLRWQG
jgi:SAM-dependent methyltransferase